MVEDKDMVRTVENGPRATLTAKAELPQILNTQDFDFKVDKDGQLDQLVRKGEENRHTALAKLHDIHDFLHVSEEAYKAFDIKKAVSRTQLVKICGRLSTILDSVPTFLETRFASQFKRPKEQAMLEQIRLEIVVQKEKITRFLGQVDELETRLRMYGNAATEVAENSHPQRRRLVVRLPKSALHFARNMAVAGLFVVAGGGAAQGDANAENPDQLDRTSIVFNDNLSENGEAADSAFNREMTTLIRDIGGIGGFIDRLEKMMMEIELSAVEGELSTIIAQPDEKVDSANPSQQQGATPTVPPQEVEPTSVANIRKGPSTETADEGDINPSVGVVVVSKYTYPNGEVWAEVQTEKDERGWVRGDLLPIPENVVDVTDLENIPVRGTDRSIIDVAADQEERGERRVIQLGDIRNAYEDFRRGLPAGTFEPGVLEIITQDGKVFGQTRDVEFTDNEGRKLKNEAGSVITISYRTGDSVAGEDPEKLYLLPAIYGPGQYRDQLVAGAGLNGIEGYQFSGENVEIGYLRFGGNVIFNYDQASIALRTGVASDRAMLENSFILREGSYPASLFRISEEGEKVIITFETGERFDATFINGVWEATKVEGAALPADRLTAIEFPESATQLDDRGVIPLQGQAASIGSINVSVFSNLNDNKRSYDLSDNAWRELSPIWSSLFEKMLANNIDSIYVPLIAYDPQTRGHAPKVQEDGTFIGGEMLAITIDDLKKGININRVTEAPPSLKGENGGPQAAPQNGMIGYLYDSDMVMSFGYRIDNNKSQGITFYQFNNEKGVNNNDLPLMHLAQTTYPALILDDYLNAQIEAINNNGSEVNVQLQQQAALDRFFLRANTFKAPWTEYLKSDRGAYDLIASLRNEVTAIPR